MWGAVSSDHCNVLVELKDFDSSTRRCGGEKKAVEIPAG